MLGHGRVGSTPRAARMLASDDLSSVPARASNCRRVAEGVPSAKACETSETARACCVSASTRRDRGAAGGEAGSAVEPARLAGGERGERSGCRASLGRGGQRLDRREHTALARRHEPCVRDQPADGVALDVVPPGRDGARGADHRPGSSGQDSQDHQRAQNTHFRLTSPHVPQVFDRPLASAFGLSQPRGARVPRQSPARVSRAPRHDAERPPNGSRRHGRGYCTRRAFGSPHASWLRPVARRRRRATRPSSCGYSRASRPSPSASRRS